MSQPAAPEPFEQSELLADVLREQGALPEECTELLPALRRLSEWQAPQPEAVDSQRLLARLTIELPVLSTVRQSIREHQQRQHSSLSLLLATARVQLSLFSIGFWLMSALITLVGAVVVLSKLFSDQELVLRTSGPLLAYIGTLVAFRGRGARVLELELVCPPSPLQLVTAQLVIVLGYDVGLGLALSLALWAGGTEHVLVLALSWLMPLLLVAGIALMLSLRFSLPTSGALAYGSWLLILLVNATSTSHLLPLTPHTEALLGGIGVLLIVFALLWFHTALSRFLPHT